MALSRKTQKDVGKYQAKIMGPFTFKQAGFVLVGAILSVIAWKVCGAFGMEMTDKVAIICLIMIPFALLGFLNPYGMSCWEFVKNYYEYHMLSSKKRVYQTVSIDDEWDIQQKKLAMKDKETAKQYQKPKKPKHVKCKDFPEYL